MEAFDPVTGDEGETRGEAITRRRLALGINSFREFVRVTGTSRNAITAAERDEASDRIYERLEAWLDQAEEGGVSAAPGGDYIEISVKGGTFSLKGHVKDVKSSAEIVEAVSRLLREQHERDHH